MSLVLSCAKSRRTILGCDFEVGVVVLACSCWSKSPFEGMERIDIAPELLVYLGTELKGLGEAGVERRSGKGMTDRSRA